MGVRAKTLLQSWFRVKLTPMGIAVPLQSIAFFFQIGISFPKQGYFVSYKSLRRC
ncbi:hypothetical protein FDUTEX481_07614 [Tolypothrix sp. PCC 7601]|nr:hypothetical protein FDUTEX481_07614 [Tolypothrix sp. PCC 7601]